MEGDGVDADLGAEAAVDFFDLPAHLLAVVEVHAEEHLGPVVGLGAADAGGDGDEGVAVVVLAGEEGLQLDLGHAGPDLEELLVGLGQEVLVAGLLGHLVGEAGILEARDHVAQGVHLGLEGLELAEDLAGLALVIPEAGLALAFL